MNALPSWLVEASNGTLIIVLMWMIIFDGLYIIHKVRDLGGVVSMLRAWWRQGHPPAELKAAFALMMLFVGSELRTYALWWFRHMQNQGIDPEPFRQIGIAMLIAGTAMAVWGGMCWLKVIMPSDLPRGTWLMLSAIAVGFALIMVS